MSSEEKEEWIEASEAVAIISANSGHTVSQDYLRLRSRAGFIRWKPKDKRQNYYLKSDVQKTIVRQKKPQSTDTQQNGGSEKAA